jgi:hypothetical protein
VKQKKQLDMKKVIQILAIAVVMLVPVILSAQPMPFDTGVGGGELNNPVGGAAPIGGGLLIMLSLAIGYGTKKIYDIRKKVLD